MGRFGQKIVPIPTGLGWKIINEIPTTEPTAIACGIELDNVVPYAGGGAGTSDSATSGLPAILNRESIDGAVVLEQAGGNNGAGLLAIQVTDMRLPVALRPVCFD